MTDRLRIALPKSKELDLIRAQFRACGFEIPELTTPGLQFIRDPIGCGFDFEVFRLSPGDVGTYVEHAISHIGVISTDVLRESGAEVWRPLTFPYGKYPLVFAAPRGESIASLSARPQIRIATPFPNFTREMFAHRGMAVEVVKVTDSVTACLLGLADGFVDRLLDPAVLLEQDFRVVEHLGDTRLKLIVNRASWSRRRIAIEMLVQCLKAHQPPAPPEIAIPFDDEDDLRGLSEWEEDL